MSDIPIGRAVRHVRNMRQLSQSQLAILSGIGRTSLIQVERGKSSPGLRTIAQLATALQIQPYKLLKLAERMGGAIAEEIA